MSPHNFPQNRSMCNLYSITMNQAVTMPVRRQEASIHSPTRASTTKVIRTATFRARPSSG